MAHFCSWCGSALEPGARYCPECGARVLESVTLDGSADAVNPMRGFDIVAGEAVPADKTAKLDRDVSGDPADTDTLVLPTDNAQKRFTLEGAPKKSRAALIVCIVVIVILLAVVAVLAYLQWGGANAGQAPQEQTQQEVPAQDAEADAENDAKDGSASGESTTLAQEPQSDELTDEQVFSQLDAAYDRLSSYDERIGDCVEDFNGLFLTRSMDDRTQAKTRAETLLGDLQDELAALEDLKVGASSPYADDAANVIELYGCQAGRVSSLVDAWAEDVKYNVPSEHRDEILAVLAQNNEGGTNKYLTRYDELYPTAKPVAN